MAERGEIPRKELQETIMTNEYFSTNIDMRILIFFQDPQPIYIHTKKFP